MDYFGWVYGKMCPRNVIEQLNQTFYGEWFGRGGPVSWPA